MSTTLPTPPKKETGPVSYDPATNEMVVIASESQTSTVWDRYAAQKPQCGFGTKGICCKICHMGPCRITPKAPLGVCGANADTIAARNLLREIAAGTAAHSEHGRTLVRTLKMVAQGKTGDYTIKDPKCLHDAAKEFDIETADRTDLEIAN